MIFSSFIIASLPLDIRLFISLLVDPSHLAAQLLSVLMLVEFFAIAIEKCCNK
jgi:hypothetical protein